MVSKAEGAPPKELPAPLVELDRLTGTGEKQADYREVLVPGPYKSAHYRPRATLIEGNPPPGKNWREASGRPFASFFDTHGEELAFFIVSGIRIAA